jgi:tetratricopeptide (TPR) repeat protein
MLTRAVELDSTFALAYAMLSTVHSAFYFEHRDRSEQRKLKAKNTADTALRLHPDLPEAHESLAEYYYHCELDYDRALEHLTIALDRKPNSVHGTKLRAWILRRQGRWEQALKSFEELSELDPLSDSNIALIGLTHCIMRNYEEAERYLDWAISLNPLPFYYYWKSWLYLLWQGDVVRAGQALPEDSEDIAAEDIMSPFFAEVRLSLCNREYTKALDQLSMGSSDSFYDQFQFIPKAQLYAQINESLNRPELAHAYYDSARTLLETKVEEQPRDGRLRGALGIAHAGLGHKEDAIEQGTLAAELIPMSEDAWRGYQRLIDLARIYAMVDEHEAAIEQLEYLLSVPGELSASFAAIDPVWAPLHDHPRFLALLDKYSGDGRRARSPAR